MHRVEAAKTRIQSTIAKEPTSPVTYKGVEQSHPHEHHGITHIEDPTPPYAPHLRELASTTDHDNRHSHSHHHGPERNLSDIKSILEKSNLSDWVKAQSLQTFELLAEAEACVHGTTTDQVVITALHINSSDSWIRFTFTKLGQSTASSTPSERSWHLSLWIFARCTLRIYLTPQVISIVCMV